MSGLRVDARASLKIFHILLHDIVYARVTLQSYHINTVWNFPKRKRVLRVR